MAICLNAVKSDAGEKNIIMQIRLRVFLFFDRHYCCFAKFSPDLLPSYWFCVRINITESFTYTMYDKQQS